MVGFFRKPNPKTSSKKILEETLRGKIKNNENFI
jgi:hypothetical protein